MSVQNPESAGATLANWRAAPFSGWAFHLVRDLLPVADIAAGATPSVLVEDPQTFDAFRLDFAGVSLDLPAFLEATATDGLIILRGDRIVFEAYRGGTTVETPHILMSATKAVVGLMAGILQREDLLDIDAPVSTYLPKMATTAYAGARVRDLLDMRSGVTLDEIQEHAYAVASNWDPVAPGEAGVTLHGFLGGLATRDGTAPGGPFRYISANTDLLGWVMEVATGRPFADLVSDLLWKPLGAAHGAFITLDRAGSPRCTGGLCATVRDFARIGAMVAAGGRVGNVQVVPAAWIHDLLSGGDREAWKTGEWGPAFRSISREMSYRAGWYVTHDRPGTMFAMGIHGQNLFVDRENGVVIAKVSSQDQRTDHRALALTHRAEPLLRTLALNA